MTKNCNAENTRACPYETAIEVAEKLAKEYKGKETQAALGGIALTKKALEAVREQIECPGSIHTVNGQVDCPLRETALAARGMGGGHWTPMQFRIDLENVIAAEIANTPHGQSTEAHRPTGTYL